MTGDHNIRANSSVYCFHQMKRHSVMVCQKFQPQNIQMNKTKIKLIKMDNIKTNEPTILYCMNALLPWTIVSKISQLWTDCVISIFL